MEEFIQSFPEEVKNAVEEVDAFMANWRPKPQVWKNVQIIPSFSMEAAKFAYDHWTPREGDVFIVTYPKCGTHWMWEVVKQVLFIRDQKLMEIMSAAGKSPLQGQVCLDSGPSAKFVVSDHLPCQRIFFTHLCEELVNFQKFKENKAKFIYVYRNPKDQMVSYFHFLSKMPLAVSHLFSGTAPDWSTFFDYALSAKIASSVPEGEWYPYHIKSWLKHQNEDNVLFVAFEDMKQDLPAEVRKVATFLGVERSADEITEIGKRCTFDQMSGAVKKGSEEERINVFRKGQVGEWKTYFTVAQSELMDKKLQEEMKGTKVQFKYIL